MQHQFLAWHWEKSKGRIKLLPEDSVSDKKKQMKISQSLIEILFSVFQYIFMTILYVLQ